MIVNLPPIRTLHERLRAADVKLGYHAEEKVVLKDVKDQGKK